MLALLLPMAMASTLAPGETLPNALGVHVSQGGLETLATGIGGVVPESFTQDVISGEFECDSGDETPLGYEINNLVVQIAVDDISLVASDGRLDLDLALALTATADAVNITGDCTFLFKDLDQECGMEISASDPIDLSLHLGMTMDLLDDGTVDVEVDDLSYTLSAIGNPISDCAFADVVDALLALNPDFLTDLIKSFLDPTLEGLPDTLETTLEDALGGLNISTSVDLLGASLALNLAPTALDLSDDGLLLGFGASAAVDQISDCMDFGEGSDVNGTGWPAYGDTAWDEGAYSYDAGIFINKDFLDHVLWNVWASGVLCGNVKNLVDLPLDTDFVGNLYGESFQSYFPEAQPVDLILETPEPLTSRFEESPPINIDINDLRINTGAELDGRMARICAVGVDGTISLDPVFSDAELTIDLGIDPETFEYSEPYNELLEPGYAVGLSGLLSTLLSTLIPADLLPTIALPTWQGIGLGDVVWIPTDDGQWQGGFLTIDTTAVEPLELSGACGGCGGTDTGGGTSFEDLLGCSDTSAGCGDCSGGSCATDGQIARGRSRLGLLGALVALLALRRRP